MFRRLCKWVCYLPKLVKAAFEKHETETEEHVARLEKGI